MHLPPFSSIPFLSAFDYCIISPYQATCFYIVFMAYLGGISSPLICIATNTPLNDAVNDCVCVLQRTWPRRYSSPARAMAELLMFGH